MSLIDERIIEDFVVWARENEDKNILPKVQQDKNSYYVDRNMEESYLLEYSFRDMTELKQDLEVYSGLSADSQMLVKLVIEICKNRSSLKEEKNTDNNNLRSKKKISEKMPVKTFEKVCENPMNKKVIDKFGVWAKKNKDNNIFPQISKQEDSYYINRNSEGTYLMEYSFQNMAWLKEFLGKYSGLSVDLQMLKNITIEICRDRCGNEQKASRNKIDRKDRMEWKTAQKDGKELPQYIYVF